MAGETLDATLVLDVADARAIVDELASSVESSLGAAVDSFSSQFADAIGSVPPVVVDADASAVPSEVEAELSQIADASVAVTADASAIPGEVDAELAQIGDASVAVGADTTEANAAVQDLVNSVEGTNVAIGVDADTSDATAAVDDLAASSQNLGTQASAGSAGVHSEVEATGLLAGGAALARGEVGGLGEAAQGLGGSAAGAAVGVAAVGAAAVEFFHAGVDATSAAQRFDTIVGDLADKVEHVHVGDLSIGLADLGLKFGSTDAEMKNAIASLVQFGVNGGKTREESAQFANDLAGLSARAVSLNPALGNLSDVTESLGGRIARGGKFAAAYGLSLTAAEINARALTETHKASAAELTIQEKAFAATEIAAERYGNGLAGTVADGAKNAANEQKSLVAVVRETIETLGTPLVIPIFDIIKAGTPIVADLGKILSILVQSALPAVETAVEAVSVPLHVLAAIFEELGPAIPPIVEAFIAFKVIEFVPVILGGISEAMLLLAVNAPIAGEAVLGTAAAVESASVAIEASLGPIGVIVAGLALGAAAFGLFGGGADDSDKSVKNLTSTLITAGAVIDDTAAKALRAQLEQNHQIDDLGRANVSWADYTKAVESAGKASGDSAGRAKQLLDALNTDSPAAFSEHIHEADKSLGDFNASTDKGQVTNQAFVSVLDSASPKLGALARELVNSGQANDGLKKSILEQVVAQQAAGTATRDAVKIGADDASIKKEQTDQTNKLNDATKTLAASALPDLDTGIQKTTQSHQANVVALTDAVSAVTRYEAGALSLSDTTDILKSAQDALADAVLNGQTAYAEGAQSALVEKAALDETAASLIASITPLTDVASGTRAYNAELAAAQTANANAKQAVDQFAQGELSAKEASDALTQADQALRGELDLLLGRFLSADQASNSFHTDLIGLGDTLLSNGFSFDENTKAGLANRDALDQLAEKASSASTAILKSTGDVGQALAPLTELRDAIQKLRDDMANAGQDTSFEDALLGNVDKAIAGVRAQAPTAADAGHELGTAGADGGRLADVDWIALGAYLSGQAVTAATFTEKDWEALGRLLGTTAAGAAHTTAPEWFGTGSRLGTTGKDGVAATVDDWIHTGSSNAQRAATEGVASQGSTHQAAGVGVGLLGTGGLGQGLGGMSDVATGAVDNAANAAALAGANMHNIGYGIGSSFIDGIAAGADADRNYLAAVLSDIVDAAVRAARHAAGIASPSRVFAREVGVPIAQGLAVGITAGTPEVTGSAVAIVTDAVEAARRYALSFHEDGSFGSILTRFFQSDAATQAAMEQYAFSFHEDGSYGSPLTSAFLQLGISAGSSLLDGVKTSLGISSPSKLFADQVGRPIAEGIAAGITAGAGAVESAVSDLATRAAPRTAPQFGGLGLLAQAAAQQNGTQAGTRPPAAGTGTGGDVYNIEKLVLEQATENPTREAIRTARVLRRGAQMSRAGR